MVRKLDNLVGAFGVTTDETFGQITDILAAVGNVVKEDETEPKENAWAELVTTTYKVEESYYELWYQVRTPFSPDSMYCSFGFDKLEETKI
ncbi:hypothetical protein P59_147 [Bacillus phage P59]|nr:hypothetical protein P59_147 [Bacillus phage P59]